MTYSTLASQVNLDAGNRLLPARSIPNLPIDTSTHSITASSTDAYHLARCSSQPPEMWGRHILDATDGIEMGGAANESKQPPLPPIDVEQFEAFVLANPRHVLNLLGIEPAYHPIAYPESAAYHASNNAWNGSNRNAESFRSTDALLSGHQSDDNGGGGGCGGGGGGGGLSSDIGLAPNEMVNFTIIKEGSFKKNRSIDPSSSKSSSSNLWSPPVVASPSLASVRNRFTVSAVSLRTSNGSSKRSSWIESNKMYKMINDQDGDDEETPDVDRSTTTTDGVQMDELNEKCALLCSDVRRGSSNTNSNNNRSSLTDVYKRNLLAPVSRTPVNYRFSAGDADKLEKGIKTMPSSRSLKEK